jgi:hypothetical protein
MRVILRDSSFVRKNVRNTATSMTPRMKTVTVSSTRPKPRTAAGFVRELTGYLEAGVTATSRTLLFEFAAGQRTVTVMRLHDAIG